MYDKYIIVEKDFKNVIKGNAVSGFQIKLRLPYYRGLMLSMVENIQITIDNEGIPSESLILFLHGNIYRLEELQKVYNDKWEFGEEGNLFIEKPGGLGMGEHKIEVELFLRISYRPSVLTGKDIKTLKLSNI